jgi:hypothetical protein
MVLYQKEFDREDEYPRGRLGGEVIVLYAAHALLVVTSVCRLERD